MPAALKENYTAGNEENKTQVQIGCAKVLIDTSVTD
jgi:hypothetical protein